MAATTTTSLPPQEHNDVDSALGSDTESLTQTITAENYRYRYLDNGRSIHPFESAGYLLPNDEREKHRLNFQHGIWLTTLDGRLYLAPLKQDIQNVLDVATGTGIWAMEFADKFPSAQVIGTDLSPMQPNL
ncbi:MAG: hypothetical protein M1834_006897 [Cirrosporium novae-zelandiae]|nr:MAG: hypothetical protein M1834_006897 [Cirrosporium novae-zelandiae]